MAATQHYVPQFLLRNFCTGPKEKVWAYDKHTGKSFETNIRNVAGEREFYELDLEAGTVSLEAGLSRLEGAAGAVIDRIISARSLGVLSEEDRVVLAIFVAVQMQRGPHMREHMLAMNEELRRALKGRFGIDDDVLPAMTSDEAKAMAMKSLTEPHNFAEHILNKTWLIFETPPAHPFFIGDNPVAMQNMTEGVGPMRGKIGLAVPGIEIYLPISSMQTIAFFCRSHEMRIRDGVERIRRSIVRDPNMTMGFGDLLDWMRAFRTGAVLPSKPNNVLNHNSLQVSYAERYVFSSTPDFELVESMIKDNAQFRTGPRPSIA